MSEKIRILLADDHPIFRKGLVKILDQHNAFEIVSECTDGNETLRMLEESKPDIAILDISMPGLNGLEVMRLAQAQKLPVNFIILTMYDDEVYFDEALELGVMGYLIKSSIAAELVECVKAVALGNCYFSPSISNHLLVRKINRENLIKENPGLQNLTETERRILKLIAQNKTSRQIAEQLFISQKTVDNHRFNISTKLHLKGHHKLLEFALINKTQL